MFKKIVMAHLVTAGKDPKKYCIAQIVMWPYIPPVFGEKAFVTMIRSPEWRKSDDDDISFDNYNWVKKGGWNPIAREANDVYGGWQSVVSYLYDLYGQSYKGVITLPDDIILHGVISDDRVLPFVIGLFEDFMRIAGKKPPGEGKFSWPFSNFRGDW
jgi:hypothetical protein